MTHATLPTPVLSAGTSARKFAQLGPGLNVSSAPSLANPTISLPMLTAAIAVMPPYGSEYEDATHASSGFSRAKPTV